MKLYRMLERECLANGDLILSNEKKEQLKKRLGIKGDVYTIKEIYDFFYDLAKSEGVPPNWAEYIDFLQVITEHILFKRLRFKKVNDFLVFWWE